MPVAKHGNRAASSKAGAADTLEALGLDMDAPASDRAEATLHDIGICFLFAANHHPAMKRITPDPPPHRQAHDLQPDGPARNPAHVTRQLIGIARPDYARPMPRRSGELGTEAGLIVSGEEGLDESRAPARRLDRRRPAVDAPDRIAPEDAGLPRHPIAAIHGGDPAYNAAAALRRLLHGEHGAYRDAVLLNAAAALIVAGKAADWHEGVAIGRAAIDSGAAKTLLARWIGF